MLLSIKFWKLYTKPEPVTQWNTASDDWYSPRADNDLRVRGKFLSGMEAKDGSSGFDFTGIFDEVKENAIEVALSGHILTVT